MQQYTVYLYLKTALYVSDGISTHHHELISLYLQYLALLRPILLPVVHVTGWYTTGSSNGLSNVRYCRYSDKSSWWWVEIPPETCRAVCRYKYTVYCCILFDNYWHKFHHHTNLSSKRRILLPYFSIDNAHLMYNAHPKLLRHSFWCIYNAHDVFFDR